MRIERVPFWSSFRQFEKDFVSIHHMRAHALSAFLVSESLRFPFLSMLISGGHALIVVSRSADDFVIYGQFPRLRFFAARLTFV